jgi:FtsH-binding integral membrane protein
MMQNMETMHVDSQMKTADAWEKDVRSGFVQKVYGILSVQLLLTAAIAYPIYNMPQEWINANRSLADIAMLVSLVMILGVGCCCQEVARKFPQNYVFLFVVTVCESIIVGIFSHRFSGDSIMYAVVMTAGIFFGLTVFAFTTKHDFTGIGPYLYVALLGMVLTGCLMMFFPYSPLSHRIMAGIGTILFSFYIVYDTQLIIGGRHKKHQFAVDDYVWAALNIYLDIINLFIYLLELTGERR